MPWVPIFGILSCLGLMVGLAPLTWARLVVWIAIDHRRVKARLHEMEASGIARRSGRSATDLS